jgi:hypothetical protein
MNLFGIAVVSHTGIEHQVEISQIQPAFGQVAADHSDAAKAYDAVVMTKPGGLDITKRDGRRQVIQPHVSSSPSWGAAQEHTATTKTPRRPGGAGGERSEHNQAQASVSTCTLRSVQPKAPLLLGPRPGQRTSKRRDGEAGRRRPVEEARDDSW